MLPNADGSIALTQLADDKSIDLRQILSAADVQGPLADLDAMVGLQAVKARVREIAAFLHVAALRQTHGLTTERPVLHMSFTGRPGTGKTTVAGIVTSILYRLGYIAKDQMVVASRNELVGQYVGHTAPKTKEIIKKARGGVLFIDEAYYLHRKDNERDYGQETIEMLLHDMEERRDELVVIFAGYKERMEEFFRANPGMYSRIGHHIDFPDYDLDELMQIADLMVARQMYFLDDQARPKLAEYIRAEMASPHFSNGRTVRNIVDVLKLRQATRLFTAEKPVSQRDLARIAGEDIP